MTIWVDGNHNVVQADASDPAEPVVLAGCTSQLLTPSLASAFAAVAQPNGGVTFDGTTFAPLPVPPPAPVPDPLKPYRDALSSAAASDPGLDTSTKAALQNLLAAMAPR